MTSKQKIQQSVQVRMKAKISQNVRPCRPCKQLQTFEGWQCLHFEGQVLLSSWAVYILVQETKPSMRKVFDESLSLADMLKSKDEVLY